MFEDLMKTLKRIDQTKTISIPIEADEKGYVDKQCPSKECEFIFKVNQDDWRNIFKDENVWCPFCRHEAPSNQWFTLVQVEHSKAEALSIIKGQINNAIRSDAQNFNRKQPKNSFITMSMKVGGGTKRTYAIPARAAEEMQLEIACEECNARFSVIGSAYFCPACGHNSVSRTFSDSLRKIRSKIDNVSLVKIALTESVGKDEAELTCRSLVESCILDGVVAFQKYCEGIYEPYGKPPFNVFQRINQGSDLWAKTINKNYSDWLTTDEINDLNLIFQKRHILAHNEGMVDSEYINKSCDKTYKKGQRIVVSQKDIKTLVTYLEKLKIGLSSAIENYS